METNSGVLPSQASMTLYQDDQLSWLSSREHHMECEWIHPKRHQPEVAALGTEPVGPTYQEYGIKPEVANRVAPDLGASDLALDAFPSGCSAHLRVCEKYWSAQDSACKKPWCPSQGLKCMICAGVDITRAVAKISKSRSKAVFVVPMGCTEDGSTRDWVASLDNTTLNKVILPAGESAYQDAKGQPLPLCGRGPGTGRCHGHHVCQPRDCKALAVSPVDIGESEDVLSDEELDLVQEYMDRTFHDWVTQRDAKAEDKAWWEGNAIVSRSYDGMPW